MLTKLNIKILLVINLFLIACPGFYAFYKTSYIFREMSQSPIREKMKKNFLNFGRIAGYDVYCNDICLGKTPFKISVEDFNKKVKPWNTPPVQKILNVYKNNMEETYSETPSAAPDGIMGQNFFLTDYYTLYIPSVKQFLLYDAEHTSLDYFRRLRSLIYKESGYWWRFEIDHCQNFSSQVMQINGGSGSGNVMNYEFDLQAKIPSKKKHFELLLIDLKNHNYVPTEAWIDHFNQYTDLLFADLAALSKEMPAVKKAVDLLVRKKYKIPEKMDSHAWEMLLKSVIQNIETDNYYKTGSDESYVLDLFDASAKDVVMTYYNLYNKPLQVSSDSDIDGCRISDGNNLTEFGRGNYLIPQVLKSVLARIAPNDLNPAMIYKFSQANNWSNEMDFSLRGVPAEKKEEIKNWISEKNLARGFPAGGGNRLFANPNETAINIPEEQIDFLKKNFKDESRSNHFILQNIINKRSPDVIPVLRKLGFFEDVDVQDFVIDVLLWNANPFLSDSLIEIYNADKKNQVVLSNKMVSVLVRHWSDAMIPVIREIWTSNPEKRKLIVTELKSSIIRKSNVEPIMDLFINEKDPDIRLESLPIIDCLNSSSAKQVLENWIASTDSAKHKEAFAAEIHTLEQFYQKIDDLINGKIKPDDLLPIHTYTWDGNKYILKKE